MAHPSEALVHDGYAAFSRGDLEALRAIFDPAIIWHVSGKSPVSGVYKGTGEVFGLFGRLFTETGGTLAHELHDVVDTRAPVGRRLASRPRRTPTSPSCH